MTLPVGPAWAALVAATRTSEHGAQVYRDAYEAGRADERAGRGGRARYRQAVVAAIKNLDYVADTGRRRSCGMTTFAMRDHAAFRARCDRYMLSFIHI